MSVKLWLKKSAQLAVHPKYLEFLENERRYFVLDTSFCIWYFILEKWNIRIIFHLGNIELLGNYWWVIF